jgi:hypothetical protein
VEGLLETLHRDEEGKTEDDGRMGREKKLGGVCSVLVDPGRKDWLCWAN